MSRHAPPDRLTVRLTKAAHILDVSPSTIERLRRKGKLASVKIGGTRLYRVEDLRRLLDAHAEGGEGGGA